jgi:5-formyltetrahydrofolate cyclo-ligase
VVCAFHPLATEPLEPRLPALLARAGLRVLVPVARAGAPLDWCELTGDDDPLTPGMLGVPEPTGPRLGPTAIRTADVVLLPALAVDAAGVRLGRGGGHYDRSLALLDPDARTGGRPRLIAVVFDDEVVDHLPLEPHDVLVTDVVTPAAGVRPVAP